jgi:hypothetical protein
LKELREIILVSTGVVDEEEISEGLIGCIKLAIEVF